MKSLIILHFLQVYGDTLNEMLNCCLHLFQAIILKLFNQIWETDVFPKDLMQSVIIQLHEKGKTDDPGNYRGISLTSNFCKCFTHIINQRLMNWANCNKVILEEQAGYRAGYSTIDHIFVLYFFLCCVCCVETSCMHTLLIFKKLMTQLIEISCGRYS